MTLESWVKFCSQQNIPGVSQQSNIATIAETTEVDRDF